MILRALATASLLPLLSGSAAACAVCFGGGADQKGFFDGLWWGIVLLIAVTFSMVSGIGYALYRVEKGREAREAAAR